jgi:hypothetical protein
MVAGVEDEAALELLEEAALEELLLPQPATARAMATSAAASRCG